MTTAVHANIDAERDVLAAILSAGSLDVEAGHRVLDSIYATGLEPQDFYLESHGQLYATLVKLRLASHPLDVVSVADHLEQEGAGPAVHGRLAVLAAECVAFTPAPHWARIVQRHARRRRETVSVR
jgi:replicative DNA helicase